MSKNCDFWRARLAGIKIHKAEFLPKKCSLPPLWAKNGVFLGKINEKMNGFMQFSHSDDFSTSVFKTVEKLVETVENSKNLVFARLWVK